MQRSISTPSLHASLATPTIPRGCVASVRVDDHPKTGKGVTWYRVVTRCEKGDVVLDAERRYTAFRELRDALRTQTRLGGFDARFPGRFGGGGAPGRARSSRELQLERWLNEVLGKRDVLDPRSLRALRAFLGAPDDGAAPAAAPSFFRLDYFENRDLRLKAALLERRLDAALASDAASTAALAAMTTQRDHLLADLARRCRPPPPPPPRRLDCCFYGGATRPRRGAISERRP